MARREDRVFLLHGDRDAEGVALPAATPDAPLEGRILFVDEFDFPVESA